MPRATPPGPVPRQSPGDAAWIEAASGVAASAIALDNEPAPRHRCDMSDALSSASAIFERDGERFVPTALAGGPWSADALHGGPPAALLARGVEHFEGGEERFVCRVTVELLRPVPRAPLELATGWVRPGKKVQLVESVLTHDGKPVARALALRLRRSPLELPERVLTRPPPPPGPEHGEPMAAARRFHQGFHTHGTEHRFVRGAFEEPGPGTDWIRLRVPLVAGEITSPLCRVCAAADFGNGVSGILSRRYTYINPDLTVSLHRYPESEWVCLDAVTHVESHGAGLAESVLYDEGGRIGRAVQSLLIDPSNETDA